MKDNIFLDTNIVIYTYSINEPDKKKKAIEIISQDKPFISTQVIKELANVLFKKFNISWNDIDATIDELSQYFTIHINDSNSIRKACMIADKYKFSFYDSLIIAAALECRCSTLYSEDMHDGQIIENTLTIKNPF